VKIKKQTIKIEDIEGNNGKPISCDVCGKQIALGDKAYYRYLEDEYHCSEECVHVAEDRDEARFNDENP
jgi:hypothetical protein